MSSAVPHCLALVDAAVNAGGSALASLSDPLLELSLALDQRDSVARLLQPTMTASAGRFNAHQMEIFSHFLDTLARRNTTWSELSAAKSDDALSKQLRSAAELFLGAKALANDTTRSDADRVTAAALLAREASARTDAVEVLTQWLTPKTPGPIQRAAVKAFGLTAADSVPALLMTNWSAFGPETRIAVLEELSSRESWALALIEEIQSGLISPASVDAVHRDRLVRNASARVKELAAKVLKPGGTASRAKVIEEYRPALALNGDAMRGAAVHTRLCAVCHKLGDVGNDIGPNLQSVVAHPPEKLIVSILDPNASIEPGYLAYSCTLASGEEFYGVIAAETGNSLIMKMSDGKTQTILRSSIASLRSANLSLMPEGLESGMTKQDLADLITFLRIPK
jgi:putative heme-binding domain-containing protein